MNDMILDYGMTSALTAPTLLGFPLLVLFAILYHLWAKHSDGKNQIHYPLLGNKESLDLREIVQNQWRQVILLYAGMIRNAQLMFVLQDKERKYMLQLPFRKMFLLPNHYVNDYAWKPEHEICVE